MWMRKAGVPALWPSRMKVIATSVLIAAFIANFCVYLLSADISYVDLESPKQAALTCRLPPEDCQGATSFVDCIGQKHVPVGQGLDLGETLPHECPDVVEGQHCRNARLPLSSLSGELGRLWTMDRQFYPLQVWAILLAVLMALLCSSLLLHDLALVQEAPTLLEAHQPKIWSLRTAARCLPLTWACVKCIHLWKPFMRLQHKHRRLWLMILPIWVVWQAVLVFTLLYPAALLLRLILAGPRRMSRLIAFLAGGLTCAWIGLFLVLLVLQEMHSYYAVMWTSGLEGQQPGCVCFCEYQLRLLVIEQLVAFGCFAILGSFSVTFRALKGLRRPQWAGLFTVLYPVPINVFPVLWARPPETGGGPIAQRQGGEPVQSEPAYDPFCFMDEQPESGLTRVALAPTWIESEVQDYPGAWGAYETGKAETDVKDDEEVEEPEAELTGIGCCGFPIRAKSHQQCEWMYGDDPYGTPTAAEAVAEQHGTKRDLSPVKTTREEEYLKFEEEEEEEGEKQEEFAVERSESPTSASVVQPTQEACAGRSLVGSGDIDGAPVVEVGMAAADYIEAGDINATDFNPLLEWDVAETEDADNDVRRREMMNLSVPTTASSGPAGNCGADLWPLGHQTACSALEVVEEVPNAKVCDEADGEQLADDMAAEFEGDGALKEQSADSPEASSPAAQAQPRSMWFAREYHESGLGAPKAAKGLAMRMPRIMPWIVGDPSCEALPLEMMPVCVTAPLTVLCANSSLSKDEVSSDKHVKW